jgi:hypothetical protein
MAARPKNKNYVKRPDNATNQMAKTIDDIAEFEDFRATLLPALRADLKNGISAKDIIEKYKAIAAARTVMIAMTEADSGKALAASKDILDRGDGRAKETVTHKHQLQDLPDNQLEALLNTELQALKGKAKQEH